MLLAGFQNLLFVQEGSIAEALQIRKNHIGTNGLRQHKTLTLAVLGQKCNAFLDCLTRIFDRYLFAMNGNGTAVNGIGTSADQTGKAKNLSTIRLEVHTKQNAALLQVFHLQERLLALLTKFFWELIVQTASNHGCNQRIVVPVLDIAGFNKLSITNDGDTVTQLKKLLELMGYEHDANAAVSEVTAGLHELLNLFLTQRRSRLVHDNHFCINQNRLRNFNHLLYAHTKGTCRLVRVNILSERSHDFLRLFVHGIIVEQSTLFEPLIDKNIIGNAKQRLNIQLLIYTRNTSGSGLVRVLELLELTLDIDFALIRLMYTCQYLNQRGFARAILTD